MHVCARAYTQPGVLCVCARACTHACLYVCARVRLCVRECLSVCVCLSLRVHVRMCQRLSVYSHRDHSVSLIYVVADDEEAPPSRFTRNAKPPPCPSPPPDAYPCGRSAWPWVPSLWATNEISGESVGCAPATDCCDNRCPPCSSSTSAKRPTASVSACARFRVWGLGLRA